MKLTNLTRIKSILGFTSIEVLITCSIIGILLTITGIEFAPILERNRLDNKLTLLRTNLAFSRIYAVNHLTNVTLCPTDGHICSRNWHENITIFVDYNANQVFDGEDYILRVLDSIDNRDKFTYPRTAVTYRPDGSLDGFQSGSFVYCPPKGSKINGQRITISQSGRFRIRDTDKC